MSKQLADLIERERGDVDSPGGAKERHWEAVVAALGGPGGGSPDDGQDGSGGSGGTQATVAAKGVASWKLLLAAAASATVVAASVAVADRVASNVRPTEFTASVRSPSDDEKPNDARSVTELIEADDPVRTVAPPSPEPQKVRKSATSRRNTRSRAKGSGSEHTADTRGLREELMLIDEAEKALRAKDPDTVLRLTARHARDFPSGALVPDRLDLEAAAYCSLGDIERGLRQLARLRRQWPHSPVSDLALRLCKD